MSVFAERLKNLRDSRGQTQGEVGKAVGKSRESVSKYEIGEREPDPEAIAAIARHFNVSADYILGITDDFTPLVAEGNVSYCAEIMAYDPYLRDREFIPYFKLAVKMKDHGLEASAIDKLLDRMIRNGKAPKSPR